MIEHKQFLRPLCGEPDAVGISDVAGINQIDGLSAHAYTQVTRPSATNLSRRRFLLAGLPITGGLLAASTAAYATAIEPERLITTTYRLTPPGWRNGPLRIVAIADLHAGGPNMTLEHISRVIDSTNALAPDLIVLLGDYIATHSFVTEHVPNEVWAGEFARLNARLGVYAILGNHDWWSDLAGVRHAFATVGIPVLENRAFLLGGKGQRFWLAGLGDQLAYRLHGSGKARGADDLPGTLAQVTTNDPVILLAHEPLIFFRSNGVPPRVSLTLAGHTHGGQIRIPFLWPALAPSREREFYAYGHLVQDGRHIIVSGGLGTSIVPVRIGVPPEIVHVEIGA